MSPVKIIDPDAIAGVRVLAEALHRELGQALCLDGGHDVLPVAWTHTAAAILEGMDGWTLTPPKVAARPCELCGRIFRPKRSDGRFCTVRHRWVVGTRSRRRRQAQP